MPKRALPPRVQAAAHRCSQRVVRREALLQVGPVGLRGRTLVERHDDVRPQGLLDLHRALGGEEPAAPVEVRLEARALLGDLSVLGEAVDLESAGVREQRPVPGHEPVQPSERANELLPRAEHQVVGVREDDLRAQRLEIVLPHRLDRRLRAHRHEERGLHRAVRGVQAAAACVGTGVGVEQLEADAHGTAPAAMNIASP